MRPIHWRFRRRYVWTLQLHQGRRPLSGEPACIFLTLVSLSFFAKASQLHRGDDISTLQVVKLSEKYACLDLVYEKVTLDQDNE